MIDATVISAVGGILATLASAFGVYLAYRTQMAQIQMHFQNQVQMNITRAQMQELHDCLDEHRQESVAKLNEIKEAITDGK